MKPKTLDKTVVSKAGDGFKSIISVILAVALATSLVPLFQMTPVFGDNSVGGGSSNPSVESVAAQIDASAISPLF